MAPIICVLEQMSCHTEWAENYEDSHFCILNIDVDLVCSASSKVLVKRSFSVTGKRRASK